MLLFSFDGTYSFIDLEYSLTTNTSFANAMSLYSNGIRDKSLVSGVPTDTSEYSIDNNVLLLLGDLRANEDVYVITYFRDPV